MKVGFEILEKKEYDYEEDGVEGAEYKVRITLPEGSVKIKICFIEDECYIEPI